MPHSSYKKILITGVASIGDAVMSLPAIHAVCTAFPSVQIDILSFPLTAPIYKQCEGITEVEVLKSGGSFSILRTLFRKRKNGYDAIVLLAGGFVWALGARLAGISHRVGLDADKRGFLLTRKVRLDAEEMHQVESYLHVSSLLTEIEDQLQAPSIMPDEAAVKEADMLLHKKELVKNPFFVINPSASTPYKMWPLERFAAVCREVMKATGMSCLLLGSKSDKKLCNDLSRMIGEGHVSDISGESSLQGTAAILARAVFYMGNNSGIMHVAAAVSTPVLCLSGPSNVRKTRPWGDLHIILSGNLGDTVKEHKLGSKDTHPTLLDVSVKDALLSLDKVNYFQK